MAKKEKEINREAEVNSDGNRAIVKFRISDFLMMLFIGILSLTCVLPFIHIAAKSISSNNKVLAKQVYFLPKEFTFDAFVSIFEDATLTYSMVYSVIVTLVFTLIGMIVCICGAYPLSKSRLKGRKFFTFILMVPMYFGAGLIPSYLLFSSYGLLDNVWVLILPLVYSAYNLLIMKTFFTSSVPESLEESAFLDGASNIQILTKIYLPLSKPILATISLFYAVGRWNAYSDNMYYIRTDKLKMVQYKLYQMVASAQEAQTASLAEAAEVTSTPEVLQAAAVMFITIPIICIYPFLQKYFVKGTMVGAVKG